MAQLILFGDGVVASHAHYHLTHDSPHDVVAFTVDRAYLRHDTLLGLPVVPFETVQEQFPPSDYAMLVTISYRQVNRLRAAKYAEARAKGYQLVTNISGRAVTWPDLVIGDNCRIGAGCVIDPHVTIGNNVVIAGGCVVGHDTVIGDHCFIAGGAVLAGSIVVEPYTFIGTGAVVRDRLRLGAATVVGAGSVILEDTPPGAVYVAEQTAALPITSDQLPLG